MSDTPRPRRPRNPTRIRESAAAIGAALDAQIPPPDPAGLGEGMLLRARQGAMRNDAMDHALLGQIAERSNANGKALDAMNARLERLDEKLDGVAYRRDIEQFMTRTEIEAKIAQAASGAKEAAALAIASVSAEVSTLRRIGWGLVSAALLASGTVLLKIVLTGAHIAT